jgi:hypothetical protein
MADQENSAAQAQKRTQGKRKAQGKKPQGKKAAAAAPSQQSGGVGGSQAQAQVLRIVDVNAAPNETARPETPVGEAEKQDTPLRKEADKENEGVVSSTWLKRRGKRVLTGGRGV